ncbi:GntR family transcriptional regulator [Pseudothermotoga thermarum]|uniref:Transcriptional regulator, GntR family n=1 Tax=Pseudothermotoga thermarum DSM 5069 TaxID=688269 RepID=F7YUG1_9THEM|nr:GntR family transcriptional regulator [Pseudothermotoga thermarum]AEH51432.1 transcriptional regulator, GntR family [Pseudothermotoga thermarum DSM 5069]
MLDRNSPIPLYVQLRELIKEKILKGEWKEGEKIPGEYDLMEQYQVSRATVREAIEGLIKEGLLVRKHGYGTFVRKLRPSLGFEPLISLSYALETFGMVSHNVVLECGFISPNQELLKQAKWKDLEKVYFVKRLRFVDDIPIAVESSYFLPEIGQLLYHRNLQGSIAKILIEEVQLEVKKVEQVLLPRLATDEERKLMNLPTTTQVIEMQRWIYAEGFNKVVYYLNLSMRDDLSQLKR